MQEAWTSQQGLSDEEQDYKQEEFLSIKILQRTSN